MNAPYYVLFSFLIGQFGQVNFRRENSLSFLLLYFFSGLVAGHVSFSCIIIWIGISLI